MEVSSRYSQEFIPARQRYDYPPKLSLFQKCHNASGLIEGHDAAAIFGERDPDVFCPSLTGFTSQLQHKLVDHGKTGRSDRMPLGDESSREIDRALSAKRRRAGCNIGAALPLCAELKHFRLIDFAEGRGIVNFRNIDIRWGEICHPVGFVRSDARQTQLVEGSILAA